MKNDKKLNQICIKDTGQLYDSINMISELIKHKQPDFISVDQFYKSQHRNRKSFIIRLSVNFLLDYLKEYKND
jgi:hypothetical protein